MSSDFARERDVASAAVSRAAAACRRVQETLVARDAIQKRDRSPVTVADFASQALVCSALTEAFPDVPVVAEEASDALRADGKLRERTLQIVAAAVGEQIREATLLRWIDLGAADRPARGRFWTLDPIDGTKGFLRGGQYAVALALVDAGGRLELGVLGCPNLENGAGARGLLMVAVRGAGALVSLPDGSGARPARVRELSDASEARLCESAEASHSDHGTTARILRRLGVTGEPLRMDSQAKYAAVARGDADIYLRLPTRADYREWIWDHAAGALVVAEAGGVVSDLEGRPLDFGNGRNLPPACGVVAAPRGIHAAVVEAVRASYSPPAS